MKLGLESYTTRNSGLDPVGVLGLAAELGLGGVLFELSPFRSFRDDELERIRRAADEKGLYLGIRHGLDHALAPHGAKRDGNCWPMRATTSSVSDAQIVIDHLRVAQKLGSPLLRCVVGNLFIRDEGHDMVAMADQAVAILREACRAAEDLGIKIAMENHADFTVRELASILARVNSPAFGFTVDCANLAFDLDAPLRLAEIMAPHALTTHYKDYRVVRSADGLALENCALGEGDIELVAMTELLAKYNPQINLNIEIHSQFAPFRLDVLRPAFWARHPSPPGDGLAWYLAKSWTKAPLDPWPDNLADGPAAWEVESRHLRQSVRWAKDSLGHLLAK